MEISQEKISPKIVKLKADFMWPIDSLRYSFKQPESERFLYTETNLMNAEQLNERIHISREKIKRAQKHLWVWSIIPWVKMVFITGSVASLNAEKDHDIDFWVITDPRRIWLTRLFDWVLLSFAGVRRSRNSKNLEDSFCVNFYKTTEDLALNVHNEAYAIQIADAIALKSHSTIYKKLLVSNEWLKEFLPAWYENMTDQMQKVAEYKLTRNIFHKMLDPVEYILGVFQLIVRSRSFVIPVPQKVFANEMNTWSNTPNNE